MAVSSRRDKRGFLRVPFASSAEVRAGGRIVRSDQGVNVSMSGMRMIVSGDVPAVGTRCGITLALGDPKDPVLIQANGRTVRSRPGELAVEFLDLEFDSYHHLRRLVMSNADDPDRAEREFSEHWGIRQPEQ